MADELEKIAELARDRQAGQDGHVHAWDMVAELTAKGLSTLPVAYGECWGMDLVSDTNQAPTDGAPYILIESRHDQPVLRTVACFGCSNWMAKPEPPVEMTAALAAMPATEILDETPHY